MNSILDDVYAHLTQAIGAARKKTPEQVRSIIDQGPFIARDAMSAGLIDALQYEDQVFGEIQRQLKLPALRKTPLHDYQKIPPRSLGVETGSRIAFVVAEGDIVRGDTGSLGNQGFVASSEMTATLRRVGADSGIRGVIVRIDSPGGDGFASDEIWREMTNLSKKKPLVVSMSDLAASGGYYMAMTGDPILAYPGTLTGSIGVFYGKVDLHGLYEKLGVNKEVITRGRYAAIDSDLVPLTADERAKVRQSVDAFYQTFLQRVAAGRKRPADQIAPIAEGRVWLGSQARSNGLVDNLGGIDQAIELIKQKANLRRDDQVQLVSYPPRRSLIEELLNHQSEALSDLPAYAFLRRFTARSWRRGGIFQLMPYLIEVK
jgi:protease-4